MSQLDPQTITLREIRALTDAETAARIKYSRDPMILSKLAEACGGNLDALTSDKIKTVAFLSELDINREEISAVYRERYGD